MLLLQKRFRAFESEELDQKAVFVQPLTDLFSKFQTLLSIRIVQETCMQMGWALLKNVFQSISMYFKVFQTIFWTIFSNYTWPQVGNF